MNRPALLLADEPTGALDTASGEDVRQLLNDLHADGQTIVLVTHDLALAPIVRDPHRRARRRPGRRRHRGGPGWRRCDERAGPGGPLRGGPPPGADRRDRAGRADRGHRGACWASLMVASNAPFDRAFDQQHGAHLTEFDGPRQGNDRRSWPPPPTPRASPRPPARSPWPVMVLPGRPPGETEPPPGARGPVLTVVARTGAGDRRRPVTLTEGRWADGPGEIVLADGGDFRVPVGDSLIMARARTART